jgi:erythromycin esterase
MTSRRTYISVVAALSLALLPRLPLQAQTDSGFAVWAKTRAIPIDSSADARRALDAVAASSRLIGIGESVHAMRPFMALRVELLKELVRRHRATVLILESGLPESIALDDFVRGRTDSVDFAAQLGPDYSGSDVVREAMTWLREWNLGAGKAHPVDVYGADMSIGDGRSMLPALDRLQSVAGAERHVAGILDSLRPIASRLAAPWYNGAVRNYGALPSDEKVRLTALVARLVGSTRAWRGASPDRRAFAERFARIVQQDEVMLREGPLSPENPRDAAMAENTSWIVARLPRGERAILWAHNAHVQRALIRGPALPPGGFPSMGYRLGKTMGDTYLAIGTAYGGPSIDSARAPRAGSVDAALGAVSGSSFLISLRDAPSEGALGAWMHADRPMRFQVGHLMLPLADAFDAIIYVDRVSPDQPRSGSSR